jgi:hypothetical protein
MLRAFSGFHVLASIDAAVSGMSRAAAIGECRW